MNVSLENVKAFELFFKRNYHLSCLVALRYVKSPEVAEDIVQETFLYLWQKRAELKITRNLKSYLLNAVKNRSINYLQRERQFDELTDSGFLVSFDEESEAQHAEDELAVQIASSIEFLPSQCKKIFLLAYQDNLTYSEIATTLSLSKNTVKTQMGIAYKILCTQLKSFVFSLFYFFNLKKC